MESGLKPPPFWTVTRRALSLRCPRCGQGRLYKSWLELNRDCPECGLEISHEHGFFIGSIYLNYGVTVALVMIAYYLMRMYTQWPLPTMIGILLVIGSAVPALATRWSRALWLGWDYYLGPAREPNA